MYALVQCSCCISSCGKSVITSSSCLQKCIVVVKLEVIVLVAAAAVALEPDSTYSRNTNAVNIVVARATVYAQMSLASIMLIKCLL